MRQNSIDYPGERAAKRADIVEQPGYAGKHYFVVDYAGRQCSQAWIPAGQNVRIKNALDRFQPDEGREAYTSP